MTKLILFCVFIFKVGLLGLLGLLDQDVAIWGEILYLRTSVIVICTAVIHDATSLA